MSEPTEMVVAEKPEQSESPILAEFVALSPYELKEAHSSMEKWAEAKRVEMLAQVDEARRALEQAVKHKWRQGPFKTALKMATDRYGFYLKIKRALSMGYLVVPNFPMDIFAVRTDRKKPPSTVLEASWTPSPPQIAAKLLPEGEGRFLSPRTGGVSWSTQENDGKGGVKTVRYTKADHFITPTADFPFALAKPRVISAASLAIAEKLFDELGVASNAGGGRQRRGDPIVLGRLLNPIKTRSAVTFFIAWVTDMRRV